MEKLKAFEILGISESASEEEIKNAYKALAKKYDIENYEAGPLREEAEEKMNEINRAFDYAISLVRGHNNIAGTPIPDTVFDNNAVPNPYSTDTVQNTGKYPEIRKLISEGKLDEAVAELSAVLGGANDAEWNFLMGSVYYYKGWLEQALHYFKTAVKLDPNNREYNAALRNLVNSAEGEMPGNPYTSENSGAAAINCACRTCTMLCCFDLCCGACRGI